MIKFKSEYIIGLSAGVALMAINYLLFFGKGSIGNGRWFYSLIVLAVALSMVQFWVDFLREGKRQKEIELKFLDFVRSLVGTVRSGIPIPHAVMQVSDHDYGDLTPFIKKLAHQLEWGIPIHEALITFSRDTGNPVIARSIAIVIEAEQSGGDMEDVLEAVTNSVYNVKKMKAERKTATYSQIVQGYLVFFIFIGIMLLLQIKLFPMLTGMNTEMAAGSGEGAMGMGVFGSGETTNLNRVFFFLVLIQGFFAGLMIGKFSEGTLKQGIIHSIILMTSAALIITTASGGIG